MPSGDFRQDSWEFQLLLLLVPSAIRQESRLNSLILILAKRRRKLVPTLFTTTFQGCGVGFKMRLRTFEFFA